MNITDLLLPAVMTAAAVYGLAKKRPIFDDFCAGAKDGIKVVAGIIPALIAIMVAVGMFRASGCLDALTRLITPAAERIGIPGETTPLVLMRPISGTGALAIFRDIISQYGPDSAAGRTASVMQGSTETTFYTLALYFSVTSVKRTRHTLVAALIGDITGFLVAALTVKLLM